MGRRGGDAEHGWWETTVRLAAMVGQRATGGRIEDICKKKTKKKRCGEKTKSKKKRNAGRMGRPTVLSPL
jgi:hypothetical protein